MYSTEGKHVLADVWGVDFNKLNNLADLQTSMIMGAKKSGANVLSIQHHQFEPNGVTILLLLSESHFSIHTYPENGFAGIDCYTCGEHVDPVVAVRELIDYLQPVGLSVKTVQRGRGYGIKDEYSYIDSKEENENE
jgi:S-adenosylmethionine decarboxylase